MSKYIVNYLVRREGFPDVIVSPEVYCRDFQKRIQSMIGLVEQICYTHEGGKDKADWSQYTQEQFQNFRRRMLDIADEVATIDKSLVIDQIDTEDTEEAVENFVDTLFKRNRGRSDERDVHLPGSKRS